MTSKEVPSVVALGVQRLDLGLQHDVQGAALCGASRSRGSAAAGREKMQLWSWEEPPQAVRASAAEVTPATPGSRGAKYDDRISYMFSSL